MKFTPPATDAAKNPGSTVLTFVNAHLAAFDEMFEKRNADFHDLAKRLQFDLGVKAQEGAQEGPETCNIFESDVLFWMARIFPSNISAFFKRACSCREVGVPYMTFQRQLETRRHRSELPDRRPRR